MSSCGLSRKLLSAETSPHPHPQTHSGTGTLGAVLAEVRAAGLNGSARRAAVRSLRDPGVAAGAGAGLTVRVVLLAHGLRGGLAVAVLLATVVFLLAQVLLGRPWGRAAHMGR